MLKILMIGAMVCFGTMMDVRAVSDDRDEQYQQYPICGVGQPQNLKGTKKPQQKLLLLSQKPGQNSRNTNQNRQKPAQQEDNSNEDNQISPYAYKNQIGKNARNIETKNTKNIIPTKARLIDENDPFAGINSDAEFNQFKRNPYISNRNNTRNSELNEFSKNPYGNNRNNNSNARKSSLLRNESEEAPY